MKKWIVFDFDGTLADTLRVFLNIYNEIAPKQGCRIIQESDLEMIRSRPLRDLMKEFGVTIFKLPRLIVETIGKFSEKIDEVKFHPGILELLDNLKKQGYKLGILTSNSEIEVKKILEMHGKLDLFDFVYSEKSLFGKHRILKKLMDSHSIDHQEIIYVGDEVRDVEAAKKVGIEMIAVSWGMNTKAALEKAGCTVCVEKVEDFLGIV